MAPSPRNPPPAVRKLVGIELARYRTEARMSLGKTSAVTGISKPKLAHLEMGRQHQSAEDIATLLATYGVEQRSVTRLVALSERSEDANWWAPWADVLPPWFTVFAGLERIADRVFTYEPTLIPGLLQTPEYATAVTEEALLVRADHAPRYVQFRAERVKRLNNPDRPLWLHAVITSGALEMPVGNADVREKQLMHLAKMADLPTVTIQVLRPQNGIPTVHTSGFMLLSFDAASQVGYVELLDDAVYLYDVNRLRTYQLGAGDLQRIALDPERSQAYIRSLIVGEVGGAP